MSVVAVEISPSEITFVCDTKTKRYNQPYLDNGKVFQVGNIIVGFVGHTKIRPYLEKFIQEQSASEPIALSDEYAVCSLFDKFREKHQDLGHVAFGDDDNILISDSKKVFNIYPKTGECFEVTHFEAIGSGADYTVGAYRAKDDIEKACKIACELDNDCGEPIRVVKVKREK